MLTKTTMTAKEFNSKLAGMLSFVEAKYSGCVRKQVSKDLNTMELENFYLNVEVSFGVHARLVVTTHGREGEFEVQAFVGAPALNHNPDDALMVAEIVTTLAQVAARINTVFRGGFKLIKESE